MDMIKGISAGNHTGRVRAAQRPGNPPKAAGTAARRHFDQVSIKTDNSFQKQLQSRISQEVRTATTTGTVAALREQVRAGRYQPDANEIARRLLFMCEV